MAPQIQLLKNQIYQQISLQQTCLSCPVYFL